MVVGFTNTYAISAYQCRSGDTTVCDKVCLWLMAGPWFSPDTPVSSTNKSDWHYITEILLKVALSTINQTNQIK
jgi:hypothetical protein